ncbi:hypothetical protein SLEP1_g39811 [Rubroshorea leprosula]|uniref:Uncharacterized protein n=1 Tax=Rubroshorea leprosula TaxID=152421 RepID=A0AAV5L1F4_9ROSI|nr:hypothetical protein SLEP1_g39811 [Rubroshorea leprosula]
MAKRRPQQLEKWRPSSRVHKNRFLTEAQFEDARRRAIVDMVGFMLSSEKVKFIEKQRKAAMPEQAKGSTSNPLLVTQEDYKMREVRDLTFFCSGELCNGSNNGAR